jgi:hypothetical protein
MLGHFSGQFQDEVRLGFLSYGSGDQLISQCALCCHDILPRYRRDFVRVFKCNSIYFLNGPMPTDAVSLLSGDELSDSSE